MAGSGLRLSLGVRAWTEMEIWCVKGMHRLKPVSCENNSGFKGLKVSNTMTRLAVQQWRRNRSGRSGFGCYTF